MGLVLTLQAHEDEPTSDECCERGDGEFKPPGFPEEGLHSDVDGCATFAPIPGAIIGGDFKAVVSGGEAREGYATLVVDDLPFFIHGVEAVPEERVFRSGEVEGGERDDEIVVLGGELDRGVGGAEVGCLCVDFPGEH